MRKTIRIATRQSQLALAQAEMVREALLAAHPTLESVTLLPMTTSGDQNQMKDLSQWGYKGLFTKEIEEALLDGRADIAVHSMKDMPSQLPDGLQIAAMLPREDSRDGWISPRYPTPQSLPEGAVVGCSSVRRTAALLRLRPDLRIIPFRGNVNTRLKKLDEGEATATLLAVAGLNRLGLSDRIALALPHEVMLPAIAQGAIGIECRSDDADILALMASINHAETFTCVSAERVVLSHLDGSCKTPLCGHASMQGEQLHLRAMLLAPDGSACCEAEASGHPQDAQAIGEQVAQAIHQHPSGLYDAICAHH